MCAVLEVSAAGYYAWRGRPVSARTTTNAALLAAIRQVHQNSGGCYGSPRVHATLRVKGTWRQESAAHIPGTLVPEHSKVVS
ncbi:IS3 family transposase [Bradyrhizobium sp. AZCC 1699]